MGAEGCDGSAGDLEARHLNCCQRRDGHLGDVDVVEADDGDIVRNVHSGSVKLVQDTDGGHIVGAHDGGGHLFFVYAQ